jgi:hypothetical protein
MEMLVDAMHAVPMPATTLQTSNIANEGDIADSNDDKRTMMIPITNNFFLPYMSAIRDTGTKNATDDRKNVITSHPRSCALMPNSDAIEGIARLTIDVSNGEMNPATQQARSTMRLSLNEKASRSPFIFPRNVYDDISYAVSGTHNSDTQR